MSDHADFLANVLAHPDDFGPRLVYADWLDERGDCTRAEFIRVQCKLAAHPGIERCTEVSANWCPVCGNCACPDPAASKCADGCPLHRPDSPHGEWDALKRRQAELLPGNGRLWVPRAVQTAAEGVGIDWVWRGGFVEEVTLHAQNWFKYADAITAETPLRLVRLRDGFSIEYRSARPDERTPLTTTVERLPGRESWHAIPPGGSTRDWRLALLKAEWPDIEFGLARERWPVAAPRRFRV